MTLHVGAVSPPGAPPGGLQVARSLLAPCYPSQLFSLPLPLKPPCQQTVPPQLSVPLTPGTGLSGTPPLSRKTSSSRLSVFLSNVTLFGDCRRFKVDSQVLPGSMSYLLSHSLPGIPHPSVPPFLHSPIHSPNSLSPEQAASYFTAQIGEMEEFHALPPTTCPPCCRSPASALWPRRNRCAGAMTTRPPGLGSTLPLWAGSPPSRCPRTLL